MRKLKCRPRAVSGKTGLGGCPQGKPVFVTQCCGSGCSEAGRRDLPPACPSKLHCRCVPFKASVGLLLVLCCQPTGTGPLLSLQHRQAAWRLMQHRHNTRLFTLWFQLFKPQKAMLEMRSFVLVLGVFHNLEMWLSPCPPLSGPVQPLTQPCHVPMLPRAAQRLRQPQHPGDDHGPSSKTSPSQGSACFYNSISITSILCWSLLKLLGAERSQATVTVCGHRNTSCP